jgi:hypothetical protein
MVSHQHPRVDLPAVTFTNLPETVEKHLAVVIGDKHRFSPVATGHHVIQCAGILKPRLAGHAEDWIRTVTKARKL